MRSRMGSSSWSGKRAARTEHTTHRSSGRAKAWHACQCCHFLQCLDFHSLKRAVVILQGSLNTCLPVSWDAAPVQSP
jgi:hypothetical protein